MHELESLHMHPAQEEPPPPRCPSPGRHRHVANTGHMSIASTVGLLVFVFRSLGFQATGIRGIAPHRHRDQQIGVCTAKQAEHDI